MERRTFESPMEWEYQNTGPVDLTSPFAQVAAKKKSDSLFSSPAKQAMRNNAFASFGTPSKPPSTGFFTPQIPSRAAAPPFRNPAFTTPRKIEEPAFSEISGAEDSPALTDISEFPNDTPDADQTFDMSVNPGTPSPTKVDKTARYGIIKSPKKYTSGKGDIRSLRESPRKELQVLRKRKRHNWDRDVSSVSRQLYREWDDYASDSDGSQEIYARSQNSKGKANKDGWVSSVLKTVDQHPTTPDNIYQWFQLGLNTFFIGLVGFGGWIAFQAVRSDINNANEKARLEIMSRISECQNHYTANECSKRDRPALRVICDEWYDCMTQDSDAIMRVKVTAKQVAEIINEFTDAMNMKAWGLIFAIVLLVLFANSLGRYGSPAPKHVQHQPTPSYPASIAVESTPLMRSRYQTPRTQRYALIEDEMTDSDTPPKLGPPMFVNYTPSGRRSPSKGERPRSPVKFIRSSSKGGY